MALGLAAPIGQKSKSIFLHNRKEGRDRRKYGAVPSLFGETVGAAEGEGCLTGLQRERQNKHREKQRIFEDSGDF